MDATRHKRLIEMLTPEQLGYELTNNGYEFYGQIVIQQNIDGKQFLNFDENNMQELKLSMNNIQIQSLWYFIQRIQKFPVELHITKPASSLPINNDKYLTNNLPRKSEEEKLFTNNATLDNIINTGNINASVYSSENINAVQSGAAPKPLPSPFMKQRSLKTPHQSSRVTENVKRHLTVSDELLELRKHGNFQMRLNNLRMENFAISRNDPEKSPTFKNSSQFSNKNVSTKYLKPPINIQGNNIQSSSTSLHLFKPLPNILLNTVQNRQLLIENVIVPAMDKAEMSDEATYINEELKKKEEEMQRTNDALRNTGDHLNKYKLEIRNEISMLQNRIKFSDKLKSLEEHFLEFNPDGNLYKNVLEETNLKEPPRNDLSVSLQREEQIFRKATTKRLPRPPATFPETLEYFPRIDKDDHRQETYLTPVSSPTIGDESLINVYTPGPILDKSFELEELIKGPSLPPRNLNSIPISENSVDILNITRDEADHILNKRSIGTFVFRKSEEYIGALTVKGYNRCFHIPIRKDMRGFYIETKNENKIFKNLYELMQFYTLNDFKVDNTFIRLNTMHID